MVNTAPGQLKLSLDSCYFDWACKLYIKLNRNEPVLSKILTFATKPPKILISNTELCCVCYACSLDEALKHLAHDRYEPAIRSLNKAIHLKPHQIELYVHRAEAFLRLTDFQSAILNYKRACVLDPNQVQYYNRLAFVYYFQGQCLFDQKLYPEALEAFSRATEMRPDVIGYHTRR